MAVNKPSFRDHTFLFLITWENSSIGLRPRKKMLLNKYKNLSANINNLSTFHHLIWRLKTKEANLGSTDNQETGEEAKWIQVPDF